MSYSISFEIPGLPKMSNTLLRRHYRIITIEKNRWAMAVHVCIGQNRPVEPLKKARITYIRHSCRKPDRDGLVSGFKFVQDALVRCGVITDDCEDVIETSYRWELIAKRQGKITVCVEEI